MLQRFEKELFQEREYEFYDVGGDWAIGKLRNWDILSEFKLTRLSRQVVRIRGTDTRLFNPPGRIGRLERELYVKVPADFADFYQYVNGIVLFRRIVLPFLSVDQVVGKTNDERSLCSYPPELPTRLIEFCDMGNSDSLALYLTDQNEWKVIFKEVQHTHELYATEPTSYFEGAIIADTFTELLERICENDGYPIDRDGRFIPENVAGKRLA